MLDHADRRMRAAIAELPDGTYYGEDHSDNDCFQKMDIAIRVALTIKGDEIRRLFLSGTGDVPSEYRELVERYYRDLAERRVN